MLEYSKLKEKPREFLAATGLRTEEFECLLPTFEKCYQAALPKKPKPLRKKKQRAEGGGRKSTLKSISDKLLFASGLSKDISVANDARFTVWYESGTSQLLDSSFAANTAKDIARFGNEARA